MRPVMALKMYFLPISGSINATEKELGIKSIFAAVGTEPRLLQGTVASSVGFFLAFQRLNQLLGRQIAGVDIAFFRNYHRRAFYSEILP